LGFGEAGEQLYGEEFVPEPGAGALDVGFCRAPPVVPGGAPESGRSVPAAPS